MKPKTVKEIVTEYLEANGYDGLCCEDCGCRLGDLFCCCDSAAVDSCEPGRLRTAQEGGESFWIIGPKVDTEGE